MWYNIVSIKQLFSFLNQWSQRPIIPRVGVTLFLLHCSTLAQSWQCHPCRGSGPPSAHVVWKHWEIQMFVTGQLSSVLPQHGVKKERGEITLQIEWEQFLINLYGMCWHECLYNWKPSKSRFNGRDFQGSVSSLCHLYMLSQPAVGWFPMDISKSELLFSFLTSPLPLVQLISSP